MLGSKRSRGRAHQVGVNSDLVEMHCPLIIRQIHFQHSGGRKGVRPQVGAHKLCPQGQPCARQSHEASQALPTQKGAVAE